MAVTESVTLPSATVGETEPQQATATGTATISAPKAATGASGLFYRIRAAVKEEDS